MYSDLKRHLLDMAEQAEQLEQRTVALPNIGSRKQ
jgi:hypothetical protein